MSKYTESFKRKVVLAYEKGASIDSLRKTYGIGGKSTIQRWVEIYQGIDAMLDNLPDDLSASLQTESAFLSRAEADELKTSLCNAELRIAYLETLLELGKELYGIDLKKKFAAKPSSR
jgi:transposase-like protein